MKIGDAVLICLLIVFFAVSCWRFAFGHNIKGPLFYTVEVDGEKIMRGALSSGSGYREIDLGGKKAVLELKPGKIRLVQPAGKICPDGICIATGWIDAPGETIVCVPNKLIVKITEREGCDFVLK